MSIESEIYRIENAKNDIKQAIQNKGVNVPLGTKLDGMSSLIGTIHTGSSGASIDDLIARNITSIKSNVSVIGKSAFSYCDRLRRADFPNAVKIERDAFFYATSITALILRSRTMCELADVYAFQGSGIWGGGKGSVYVPKNLLQDYKTNTNWAALPTYSIKAIEDYPGITGGL